MSAKPARLTAAKCEIGSPVSCWTAPIVARAPAADAARTTAGSFGESGAAASAAKRLVLPVGPAPVMASVACAAARDQAELILCRPRPCPRST